MVGQDARQLVPDLKDTYISFHCEQAGSLVQATTTTLHALPGLDERCLNARRDAGLAPFKGNKPEHEHAQSSQRKKLDGPSGPRRILLITCCTEGNYRHKFAVCVAGREKIDVARVETKFRERRLSAVLANEPVAHGQYIGRPVSGRDCGMP